MDINPPPTEAPEYQVERNYIEFTEDIYLNEISLNELQPILRSAIFDKGSLTFYVILDGETKKITIVDGLPSVDVYSDNDTFTQLTLDDLPEREGALINYLFLHFIQGSQVYFEDSVLLEYAHLGNINLTPEEINNILIRSEQNTEGISDPIVGNVIPVEPAPEVTPTPEPIESPELSGSQREHRMIGDLRTILISENELMQVLNENLGNPVDFYFEVIDFERDRILNIHASIKLELLETGRYRLEFFSTYVASGVEWLSFVRETSDPQQVLRSAIFDLAYAILFEESLFNQFFLDGQPLAEGTVERNYREIGLVTITLNRLKEFMQISDQVPITVYIRPVDQDRIAYNYIRTTYTFSEGQILKRIEYLSEFADEEVISSREETLIYEDRQYFIDNFQFGPGTLQYMSEEDFNYYMQLLNSRNSESFNVAQDENEVRISPDKKGFVLPEARLMYKDRVVIVQKKTSDGKMVKVRYENPNENDPVAFEVLEKDLEWIKRSSEPVKRDLVSRLLRLWKGAR